MNPIIIKTAVNLSRLSYESMSDIQINTESIKCITGTPIFLDGNTHPLITRDAQAYIFLCGQDIYISFRGTESADDILSDLNVIKTKFRSNQQYTTKIQERIHRGFSEQYFSIRDNMFIELDNILHNNIVERLIFTGHSMGGAIATIAILDYALNYPNQINILHCITFGCPRVGNWYFCNLFSKTIAMNNVIRFANKIDPVTFVPPLLFLFKHICAPIYLTDNKCEIIHKPIINILLVIKYICSIPIKLIYNFIMNIKCSDNIHQISLYCERINKFY